MAAIAVAAMAEGSAAWAVSCPTAKTHEVSQAEQEYLHGHFDRAVTLYQEELQKSPNDAAQIAGLTQVLLRQQKVTDADALVTAAVAKDQNSAALLIALAEVQYREGTPWLAAGSVDKAAKIDVCYARLHLLKARLYRLNSSYASAARELALAHSLDPNDPDVRRRWLDTLPVTKRIAELQAYLAADTGDDAEELEHLHFYLDGLRKRQSEPHKPCRLVSNTEATEVPFAAMMRDATHIRSFGLDVKLNDHNARLQIDTGAGGLVVNRAIAERAHLERFATSASSGVGNGGEQASYSAYADSIKIGALEFHDCQVEVIDKRNVMDIDGLIGMDVFSRFLVTLDFPVRKLVLGALPNRPDDTTAAKPALETAQQANEGEDDDADKPVAPDAKPDTKPVEPPVAAPPAVKASGPHDRYIAPEMKDWSRVYRAGHQLIIPTLLNDSGPKLFILDTGAFATTLSPAVARTVTKVHGDSNVKVHGISGEVDKVYSADSIEFKFGNIAQKANDVVSFDTPSVSRNNGMEIAGFIGATTLGQVTMSIDYRDGLVRFAYDPKHGYKYPGVP